MKSRSPRRAIRTALYAAAHAGGLWRASRRLQPGRIVSLMYHGLAGDGAPGVSAASGYVLTERALLEQIERLRPSCHFVRLREVRSGEGLSRTRTNVLLTFDDGYEAQYTRAFEPLRRLGIPAVYALPTRFLRAREPLWNDVLADAVDRSPRAALAFAWRGEACTAGLRTPEDRLAAYAWLLAAGVRIPQQDRDAFLAAAAAALGVVAEPARLMGDERYRPLLTAQVREMAGSGFAEFASHGAHHYALTGLEDAALDQELRASRDGVEAMTGQPCDVLAVPGGRYDDRVLGAAARAGYGVVLTSDRGAVDPRATVWARNGILSTTGRAELMDIVHGPVTDLLAGRAGRRRARRAPAAAAPQAMTVQQYFERRAQEDTWGALYATGMSERTYNFHTRRRAVTRLLEPHGPFANILDVGCGTGDYAPLAARVGAVYHGVDFSPAMALAARRRLDGGGHVAAGSGEALPYRDSMFDGALAIGYLEYLEDPSRTLAEIRRVLRPGGILVMQSYQREVFGRLERVTLEPLRPFLRRLAGRTASPVPPVDRPYSARELDALMARFGFSRLDRAFNNFYVLPSPLRRLAPGLYMRWSELLGRFHPEWWRWLAVNYIGVYALAKPAGQPPAEAPGAPAAGMRATVHA